MAEMLLPETSWHQFYPKADSSLGPNDKRSSEHDHNVAIHEVHYDPVNVDSHA